MNVIHMEVPQEKISNFCHRWNVVEFALFGSVLREDFDINSDIDVLVTFTGEAQISLFDPVSYTHLTLPTNREV